MPPFLARPMHIAEPSLPSTYPTVIHRCLRGFFICPVRFVTRRLKSNFKFQRVFVFAQPNLHRHSVSSAFPSYRLTFSSVRRKSAIRKFNLIAVVLTFQAKTSQEPWQKRSSYCDSILFPYLKMFLQVLSLTRRYSRCDNELISIQSSRNGGASKPAIV